MDNFRTIVDTPKYKWKLDHQNKVVLVGSCFSENIGERLEQFKFDIDINPTGIVYNPISVMNSLKLIMEQHTFTEDDLFEHNQHWHSWYHHSRFSAPSSEEALFKINQRITQSHQQLQNADYLFVTFGTSWVYQLLSNGMVVSNCHKVAASSFKRYQLTVAEIIADWKELLIDLWALNPKLKILFTVSPIRHWKDGATQNQLSKATLLLAINRLKQGFGTEKVDYFPSYEIMLDDLRDYRFYASDMLHPSEVAVNYIWQRFKESLIQPSSINLMPTIEKFVRAANHRPVNAASEQHQKFVSKQLKKIEQFTTQHPHINFEREIAQFNAQITS